MILIKCVNAYAAVLGLMDKEWDYQTAHALVMLKRKLYPHAAYYQQEEMKLVQEYAARGEDGRVLWSGAGQFQFREPDRAEAFAEKRRELGLVDVQEAFVPVKVSAPAAIKPAQLEALEGFLEFGEGEENEQTS